MGVNALILLPPDARLGDVADVIGILSGLPAEKHKLGEGAYSCRVNGVEYQGSSVPEMATITVRGDLVDGEQEHYTTWHWEPGGDKTGKRLLYPRSNTFWIAIGRRLVDFFGGDMVYKDYDDTPVYSTKKPRQSNNPEDGEPWKNFQDEKLAVKPITIAELQEADQWASYKTFKNMGTPA